MNFNDIYNPNQSLAIVLRGANNEKIVDSFYYLLMFYDEILDKDFQEKYSQKYRVCRISLHIGRYLIPLY